MGKRYVPIVIIIMLFIALGFTSTAAFAYWTDVSELSNVVIIFEPDDANLEVVEKHEGVTGMLVPVGFVFFEGQVDNATFQYDVKVDRTLVQSMNLVIEAVDVTINGLKDYEHLVEIKIGNEERRQINELFNNTVTITVVVRLIEPIDAAEAVERGLSGERVNVEDSYAAYNAIRGQTISFTLRFSVQPREVE